MRMTVVPRSVLLLCSLSLGACTYVTQQDWNEKTDCLDEDGDGAVRNATCTIAGAVEDCDDARADRAPDLEEIPYDGIDNDCDGQELVDVDGDGFPNVLEADWVSNDGQTTYPTGLQAIVDCNDDDASINPSAGEVFYDGIDANCGELDDWDADGDGYVISANLIPAGGLPYDGLLPGGDCDDTRNTVNPGQTNDVFLDGVDTDCDGTNDFDVDGDTWMEAGLTNAFDTFVLQYGYQGLFPANFGDCDDSDETIFPGADDPYYDAIDSNCLGDDDFDQDLDGFILAEDLWPNPNVTYDGDGLPGDCDDEAELVFPGQVEALGDAIDADCDGGADSTAFTRDPNWVIEGPRPPVVGRVQGVYVMALLTDGFASFATQPVAEDFGVMARFAPEPAEPGGPDVLPGNAAAASGRIFFEPGARGPFSDQLDLETSEDSVFIAASHLRATNNTDRNSLRVYRIPFDASGAVSSPQVIRDGFGAEGVPYASVDMELDEDGNVAAGACLPNAAQFRYGEVTTTSFSQLLDVYRDYVDEPDIEVPSVGSACFIETRDPINGRPDAVLRAFGDTQTNLEVDPLDDSLIQSDGTSATLGGFTVNSAVQRAGILALTGVNPGGATPQGVTVLRNGVVNSAHLTDEEVLWASATFSGNTLYMAAVVDDRGSDGKADLVLLYGNPANPTEVELDVTVDFGTEDNADLRTLDVYGASIWVDNDRVFIAVTGEADGDETAAWIFVEPS